MVDHTDGLKLLLQAVSDFCVLHPSSDTTTEGLRKSISQFKEFVDRNPSILYECSEDVNTLLPEVVKQQLHELRMNTVVNKGKMSII